MTQNHRVKQAKKARPFQRRRAMALLVVLVLVMLAAFSAYSFMFSMESQYRDSRLFEEQLNSQQAAKSGMELAAAILELPYETRQRLGGLTNNPELFSGRMIEQVDSNQLQSERFGSWRVSIIAPVSSSVDSSGSVNTSVADSLVNTSDSNRFVFGMENESAKLSITALALWESRSPGHARQALMNLPGATTESVELFLDSIGIQSSEKSSKVVQSGTNIASRASSQAQQAEQLQMQWIGGDLNCNYRQDLIEASWTPGGQLNSSSSTPTAISTLNRPTQRNSTSINASQKPISTGQNNSSQSTTRDFAAGAWGRYLTKHSGYRNLTRTGQPRINLNQLDLRALHQQLLQKWPAPLADYVILYRQFGAIPSPSVSISSTSNDPNGSDAKSQKAATSPKSRRNLPDSTIGNSASNSTIQAEQPAWALNFSHPAMRTITSPLELVGATTEVPNAISSTEGKSDKRRIPSPFQAENLRTSNYLSMLLDDVTVTAEQYVSDRIDISDAPLVVLMSVPGMDKVLAEALVQRKKSRVARSGMDESADGTIGWLLQEGVADLTKLTQIEPYLTARSDVYSCQVVGFRDNRSAVYRSTFVIDARQQPAQLRDLQNWHNWDRGFTSEELIHSTSPSNRQ